MKFQYPTLVFTGLLLWPAAGFAQSFTTGQTVYASPSGATNGWYSGCIVKDGRSNNSYQVECAGTVWWITAADIRTTPPEPGPDPMRPGHMLIPIITPSHPASAARPGTAPVAAPAAAGAHNDANGNLASVRRNIARDKAESSPVSLRNGKYTCYSGGQYTFSDLYITGPHSYSVKPGGSGSFSYSNGALTFTSGPYAGAYSRMVDGHTIGVSSPGNHNLGTQCGFEK
jgi:hypothetical protein